MSAIDASDPTLSAQPGAAADAVEFTRLQFMSSSPAAPRGDGHAVVLFPGLGTDSRYMAPLARYCEKLGYVAYDWGRGRNTGPTGPVNGWLAPLATELESMVGRHTDATFIGWSLGGIYAREIAKRCPGSVRAGRPDRRGSGKPPRSSRSGPSTA